MEEPIEGNDQMELVNFAIELADDPDSQHPEAIETIEKSDTLLSAPFQFYSFNINLNANQQIDIANRCYSRYYKKKICDLYNQKEVQEFEIENNRKTLKEALKDQQRTAEMIKTLNLQKAIVDEERVTLQKEAARRVKKIS